MPNIDEDFAKALVIAKALEQSQNTQEAPEIIETEEAEQSFRFFLKITVKDTENV
jgi:hypothetical protein